MSTHVGRHQSSADRVTQKFASPLNILILMVVFATVTAVALAVLGLMIGWLLELEVMLMVTLFIGAGAGFTWVFLSLWRNSIVRTVNA